MTAASSDMRLFDDQGRRLYLSADERQRFLDAAAHESREHRMFCHVLHYSGCRPSEALALTARSVLLDSDELVIRSLKKRATDARGRAKGPQYRTVPVPHALCEQLDLVFDLRRLAGDTPLWPVSRTTAWRMVRRVMQRAGIEGPQASPKGLRHGFGIAMLSGAKPLPLTVLRDLLGHTDIKTTEIYLQVTGAEKRALVMNAWD